MAERTRPRISLVTVVLNAAGDFRRTRLSIEGQKRDWLEWVVVDGGSTDGTLAEIEEARHLIDVLVVEKDDGIYDAMNKGCRAANGDFLWYMNAGDEVYPDAVNRLHGAVGEWSVDCIYCAPWKMLYPNGDHELRMPEPEDLDWRMSVSHQATIHSKAVLEKASMYDRRYRLAADYDFFLKSRIQGIPFVVLDFPLATYRIGGRSNQSPITSNLETLKSLWRNDSNEKWRGTRFYIQQIWRHLRVSLARRVPERLRKIFRPFLHRSC